jgi:twitching motility protein PilT
MAIQDLFEKGQVTEETAMLYCTNKGIMSRGIDRIKKLKGEEMHSGGLKLDIKYGKRL